jgi:hypothetical protein
VRQFERKKVVARRNAFPDKGGHIDVGGCTVADDRALAFIQRHLKSVWALELLLLFHNHPEREWRRDSLVRELRGSEVVVNEALAQLRGANLLAETPERLFKYEPSDSTARAIVAEIAQIYSTRPVAVIKAISGSPSDKLRIFSDAFKIRGS